MVRVLVIVDIFLLDEDAVCVYDVHDMFIDVICGNWELYIQLNCLVCALSKSFCIA